MIAVRVRLPVRTLPQRSLYKDSISALVKNFNRNRAALVWLPENILFDIFHQIYQNSDLNLLQTELADYQLFSKLLKVGHRRACMHKIIQFCKSEDFFKRLTKSAHKEILAVVTVKEQQEDVLQKTVEAALNAAGFLGEGGWYEHAHGMLLPDTHDILSDENSPSIWLGLLNKGCLREEMYTQLQLQLLTYTSNFCRFKQAEAICNLLIQSVERSACDLSKPVVCRVYNEISKYFFLRSEYHEAYHWAIKALKGIELGKVASKLIIDILRQASKSCVLKREFVKAEMLIKQAVCLSEEEYGVSHVKYSDCLIDYGFYLLNVDSVGPSMQVYQEALDVRLEYFGGNNLKVAIAHEDLAYSCYVFAYGPGNFDEAKNHAESSLRICQEILPEDHFLLASPKRVLALILEEIAIDNQESDPAGKDRLLEEAEKLHLFALKRSLATFGERNVQTAKHRGNLGRLYQTMMRYREAERMHLKAIQIKEDLLGPDDYEVALSLGHLAALYNYDMQQYNQAEELYLRSIKIGLKLFGPSYSGLEYDYRGLIQVYETTEKYDKLSTYTSILSAWNILKDEKEKKESEKVGTAIDVTTDVSLQEVITTVKSFPDLSNMTLSAP